MTLLMIRITKEEVIDILVDILQIGRGHGFECLPVGPQWRSYLSWPVLGICLIGA